MFKSQGNVEVDTLAKEASANEVINEFDEIQYMPSIDQLEMLHIEGEEYWMTPIVSYLKDEKLPKRKDKARKLKVKSDRYILIDEMLYKRGFSQPYLRCLAPDEANYLLREVHEGACGNHSGARSLVHKVVEQDTTGQQSKLMLRHMLRYVINVNVSVICLDSHQRILPNDGPFGFYTVGFRYLRPLSNCD